MPVINNFILHSIPSYYEVYNVEFKSIFLLKRFRWTGQHYYKLRICILIHTPNLVM